MPKETYEVTAGSLNLRSEPLVKPSNRVAVLPQGQEVTKIGEASVAGWWEVETVLSGSPVRGYVNSAFLSPKGGGGTPAKGVVAVHLPSKTPVRRDVAGGWASPLNERDQPGRDRKDPAEDLAGIVEWLAVDENARYLPKGETTYCNVYAYDYAYLGGTYLPRVWWTSAAIRKLSEGQPVVAKYGATVTELNANGICDWFEQYGPDFGWERTFDLDRLQSAANEGAVCIVVAQRRDLNRSGHIVAVVPENGRHNAVRVAGRVTRPLQSQAGSSNFKYGGMTFWTQDKFRKHGFWIHR